MKQSAKKLVKQECACYFANDYCCMRDDKCIYFTDIEKKRCKYFESYVLPLDQDYQLIYNAELDKGKISKSDKQELIEAENAKFKPRIKCKNPICNKIFPANSNRQKYCPSCSKQIKREQNRNRVKNHRINSKCNALEGAVSL